MNPGHIDDKSRALPRQTNGSALADADLSIAIPTINSSRYIEIILSFYRQHDIPVTVFVDDRSVDDTYRIVRHVAPKAHLIRNPGNVVEDLLPQLSRGCGTKWVLRIDDDELPSLALLEFVEHAIRHDVCAVYGFPRLQCAVSPAGQLLADREIAALDCRQWRLYQPARVSFHRRLHTSGFHQDHERNIAAPDSATLIHLDWAVHSSDERARKIDRYDAHTANAGTLWRAFYLYEEEVTAASFAELTLPEFRETAGRIAETLGELCVAPEAKEAAVAATQ